MAESLPKYTPACMKGVVVLGSTGSIGVQALDVIRQHPSRLTVVGLAAGSNESEIKRQGLEWPQARLALHKASGSDIPNGIEAVAELARHPDADIVLVGVSGVVGLLPTIAAIESGKDIALASKEVLVAAGEIVMPLVCRHGVRLLPVDSEHSAVFQCIQGYSTADVTDIYLTASGGPFRDWTLEQMKDARAAQALKHPTWNMGGKITIDSATLMNKGLETIEAKWLFDLDVDNIHTVVHPQSIIHSFVKFADGSVLGQAGRPDMRMPIQYALLYPDRVPGNLPEWSPFDTPSLTFEALDAGRFTAVELAKEASRLGGTAPCALNAANEEAANAFLREEIGFLDVIRVVEETMRANDRTEASLEAILECDARSRAVAQDLISARH